MTATQKFAEESIELTLFHSSEDLKNEIGQRIQTRRQMNWDLVDLVTKGPILRLIFKQALN